MDHQYLSYTWWFLKDWTFIARPPVTEGKKARAVSLGIPVALELAEEYVHEDFRGPVITFHSADETTYVLDVSKVLSQPKKNPDNYHPTWKRLFAKGVPQDKSAFDCCHVIIGEFNAMQEETQKAESDVDIGEPEVLAPRVLTYQSLGDAAPAPPPPKVLSPPPQTPQTAPSGPIKKTKRSRISGKKDKDDDDFESDGGGKEEKDDGDEDSDSSKPKRRKKTKGSESKKSPGKTGNVKFHSAKQDQIFEEEKNLVEEWKKKHFFARVPIDPRVVKEPSPEIRIRETTAAHIEKLRESFLKTRTKNPNVSLIALGFKGLKTIEEMVKHGLQAWEGLHTTKACSKLADQFPKNPFWQTYLADVYTCPDTPENRRILRLVGNLSNFKSSIHLELKFADMVKMQHDQMFAERARRGIAEDADLPKGMLEELKRDWAYSTNQSMAQIQSVCQVAKTRGRLWERIWKVLSGNVDFPEKSKKIGFRPPQSCHHFNFMAGIEEDTICDLLDEVIRGEATTATFKAKCEKVRGVKRMRREILGWLKENDAVPKKFKNVSWDAAAKQYPAVASQDFFDVWEVYFIGLKEKESPQHHFFEQLESRFQQDVAVQQAAQLTTGNNVTVQFPGVQCRIYQADYRQACKVIPAENYQLIFHDAPYGLELAEWDKPLSREDFKLTLSQIFPQNKADSHVYVGMCHYTHKAMFAEVLREKGYIDVHEACWQKIGINVPGHQRYTFSFENIIVAYYGGRRKNVWNVPDDPMQRLNTIFGPVLRHSLLTEDGTVVNPAEKPAYIARIFAKYHVSPGNHVLVLGAGTGSDVLGALAAGCNVVAIERDVAQFPYLVGRLQKTASAFIATEGAKPATWVDVHPMAMAGTTGIPTAFHGYFNQPWKFDVSAASQQVADEAKARVESSSSGTSSLAAPLSASELAVTEQSHNTCVECSANVSSQATRCSRCNNAVCPVCSSGNLSYTCSGCQSPK